MTDSVDLREAENAEIQGGYHAQLALRGQRNNFSPEFLNAQPRSLAEKLKVTPEEEEQILYLYAATYSIHRVSQDLSISLNKVRSVVYLPDNRPLIDEYRTQMKLGVLDKISETQQVLLDAMQDPDKLQNSSITQISKTFQEISEVQGNIVSSIRDSHDPTANIDPSQVFGGEDLEYIALLRRRLSIGAPDGATGGLPPDSSSDSVIEARGSVHSNSNGVAPTLEPWETDPSEIYEAFGTSLAKGKDDTLPSESTEDPEGGEV